MPLNLKEAFNKMNYDNVCGNRDCKYCKHAYNDPFDYLEVCANSDLDPEPTPPLIRLETRQRVVTEKVEVPLPTYEYKVGYRSSADAFGNKDESATFTLMETIIAENHRQAALKAARRSEHGPKAQWAVTGHDDWSPPETTRIFEATKVDSVGAFDFRGPSVRYRGYYRLQQV